MWTLVLSVYLVVRVLFQTHSPESVFEADDQVNDQRNTETQAAPIRVETDRL